MKNRPILITILGVLSILSGLIGILSLFTEQYSLYKLFLGNAIFILMGGVAVFKIFLGIGFLKGWTWTWFGGIFVCVFKVGQNIVLLMSILLMGAMPVFDNLGLVFKTLMNQIITLLLILYLMNSMLVDYFHVDEFEKVKYLIITSVASLLLLVSVCLFFITQGGSVINFF